MKTEVKQLEHWKVGRNMTKSAARKLEKEKGAYLGHILGFILTSLV